VVSAVTDLERAVADEILRIARDELRFPAAPPPAEALAAALDSLQLLSLVVAVEDRFHVILTEEDGAAARSLEDLARLVAGRADPARLPVRPSAAGEVAPP
jgi:acyl carrier protein